MTITLIETWQIKSKNIISSSYIPTIDWVLNIFNGVLEKYTYFNKITQKNDLNTSSTDFHSSRKRWQLLFGIGYNIDPSSAHYSHNSNILYTTHRTRVSALTTTDRRRWQTSEAAGCGWHSNIRSLARLRKSLRIIILLYILTAPRWDATARPTR